MMHEWRTLAERGWHEARARGTRALEPGSRQYAGLDGLALVTAVLCLLALTHTPDVASAAASSPSAAPTAASATPSVTPSATPEPQPTATPITTPAPSAVALPDVTDVLSTDFAGGAGLPIGARIHDNQAVGTGMALSGGALVQGPPSGRKAVSSLEVQLPGAVQKLGATVSFPPGAPGTSPGTVVLVAWQDSLLDARDAHQPVPRSGLRLEIHKRGWRLTTYDRVATTAQTGTYPAITGTAQVTVYRAEDQVYVVDPTGAVTQVTVPDAATLAGPWACWQLTEDSETHSPAQIQAIVAG